ncbi:MAG: protoporphyrinogen/coproporphyrinogen oxidase, partial [Micromonosporaceae bacterium]
LGTPVREVRRVDSGFRLQAGPVPDPSLLDADGVVVAVPASKAAPMLRQVVPWAAGELARIGYASLAIVTLVYPRTSLPQLSGLLVPGGRREGTGTEAAAGVGGTAAGGFTVKALTFSSRKWAHLDDGRHTVLRASIGRYGEEQVLHHDDAELVTAAVGDVAELTGLVAPPVASRVSRWGGALPQYAVGHTDRVRRIQQDVAKVPGLAVCGAAYEGVGIPACIRSGQAAAAAVLADLRGQGGRRAPHPACENRRHE